MARSLMTAHSPIAWFLNSTTIEMRRQETRKMKQTILTFITKVNPARISDLKALLEGMAKDVEGNAIVPFPKLRLLHFASLVVIEDPDHIYDPCLVFENNFDGPLEPHLEDLYAQAAE